MNLTNSFIPLKDDDWLQKQRVAGKCVAHCLEFAKQYILNEKNPNLSTIESECLNIMRSFSCTPSFLGYKGNGTRPFPSAICTSVNKELVHGIVRNYVIQEGDVVKIDLGATFEGAIGDAAITVIRGMAKNPRHAEMVKKCEESLYKAIEAVEVGKRIGVIGNAIAYVAKQNRFGLVESYGGHGLNHNQPHAAPFVPNKSSKEDGVVMREGLTLAIEPLFSMEDTNCKTAADGWSVMLNSICAHFEHTIYIHKDRVEIITQ